MKKIRAYSHFCKQAGKVIHYLNTISVGLSGVESGVCVKPEAMDISWHPCDLLSSSRGARLFVLQATIVFIVEEIVMYVKVVEKLPNFELDKKGSTQDRAAKFKELSNKCLISNDLSLGPLLLIHWRNRIIHVGSTAKLSQKERDDFLSISSVVKENYKNLDVQMLLEHFEKNKPTLKDVSSLIAMSMNWASKIQEKIVEPESAEELILWLKSYELYDEFLRICRVAKHKKGGSNAMLENFFNTHAPELLDSYLKYGYEIK